MKTKLIATTLLVGALTTSVLAHGNNMQGMNCMNGQMMCNLYFKKTTV